MNNETKNNAMIQEANLILNAVSLLHLRCTVGLVNRKDEFHKPYDLLVIPNRVVPEYDDSPGVL